MKQDGHKEVSYQVLGMHCADCAREIEKRLETKLGVEFDVDFANALARLRGGAGCRLPMF